MQRICRLTLKIIDAGRPFGDGTRRFHASKRHGTKVAVIGAAGGIGQPLSLLMKYNPLVTDLSLYDVAPMTPGVAADISHVNCSGKVQGYSGEADLENKNTDVMGEAIKDANLVIVPAGVPRQPGMTRDDLFSVNGDIVESIAKACSKNCPEASYLIISNPVNSTIPIFAETLKNLGTYDKNKLFGVTYLDVCRAKTFVAENQDLEVENVEVDVIGGHAGVTILPVLSGVANVSFSDDDIKALTKRIQFGGDEVVQAKAGNGSATLSMAHAGASFANQVLRAANGERGLVECSYVQSKLTDSPFFSSPVRLGKYGIEEILPLPKLNSYEKTLFDDMIPQLKAECQQGIDFIRNRKK